MTWSSLVSRIRSAVSERCVTRCSCSMLHGVPDVPQLGVGKPRLPLGQRGPFVVIEGQHGGFRPDPDHGAQPGRGRARVFGRVGQQGPAFHGPVRRLRRAAGDLPAQQDRPVQPVDRAGRLLVLVVDGDVQPVAGARRRGVVTRSGPVRGPRCRAEPGHLGHLPVRAVQRGRDLRRAGPQRRAARHIPDAQADRAPDEQRDQERQERWCPGRPGGRARRRRRPATGRSASPAGRTGR